MSVFTKVLESWNASCDYLKGLIDKTNTRVDNNSTQISDIYNRCGGGKNLIDFKNLKYARSGYTTYVKTDDSITATSNGEYAHVSYYLPKLEIGKQYKLSFKITNFAYTAGSVRIRLSAQAGGTGDVNKDVNITSNGEYSVSFTVTDSNVYRCILFYPNFSASSNVNSFTCSNLMLKFAESGDDTYVPYVPTNAEIQDFLVVKTYNHSCFVQSVQELSVREGMKLKESGYAWVFDLFITYINGVQANTKTKLGTVTPAPPRILVKHNVTIMKNDNSGVITNDAVIEIDGTGSLYITSPVAIRPTGTGEYGRIYSAGSCVFEAIKL